MKAFFGAVLGILLAWTITAQVSGSDQHVVTKTEIRGTPRLIHYSREDFHGDPQIWTMCQDDDGILYFGNNDGTLIFDGARWRKIPLPNHSSVRSLLYSSDGKVYAGGFNDFGVIEKDEYGNYSYRSYMDQLRVEDRNLENIWDIHEVQNHIIFRSFSKLVAISNNKAFTIPAENYYHSSVINDQLYLVDPEGIKRLDLETFELETVVLLAQINNESIAEIIAGRTPDELTILTKPGSAYHYQISERNLTLYKRYLEPNSNNQIISAIKSTGGNSYLGTLNSEILILDASGEIISVNDEYLDLQDNTVLNLFESSEGNIWALLNNGIDCINITSPVSILFENASVFDVIIRGGKFYAATNQGVFISEKITQNPHFTSLNFKQIQGLDGQSWSIQVFNGKILVGHDGGLFIIDNDQTLRIPGVSGVWKVIPIKGKPDHYFVCTYTGIHMMNYTEADGFQVLYRMEGFNESSRDIIQSEEEGVFWVCHGYKGVFKVQFDKNYQKVLGVESFREKGLPSPFNINVYRWQGDIVFTTNSGIFTYNKDENQFEPHTSLNSIFGIDKNVRKLLEYDEQTWFVHDDEVGYFEEDQKMHKGLFLELKGTFNRGMECILPINRNNVLIGTTTGLYAYDLTMQQSKNQSSTLLSEISFWQGEKRIKAPLKASNLRLSHDTYDFRFEYSAPQLKDQNQVQYSYMLEGVDQSWSEWSTNPYKEFARLYPGNYTFRVKGRSMIGETASEVSYNLTMIPIWYRTKVAYVSYLLVIAIGLIASRKLVKRKIATEKEKTRVEEKKKQTVLELELQQMKLEREKERIEQDKKLLEEDVIFKSKELANYTMLLVRKRELLTDLREDLKELKEVAKNEKSRNMLRNLVRKIGIHLNDEEHIHVFEANFERVHHEFFEELKTHFPDLTAKELRLCALVKMNLTNKEIAPILNISLRGVETARYRLRKRLSLEHEENMVEFLEKLAP
ncbi:triple tyrosine motif-containing protein [Marinoscillum sp.]|uniref:helix-turn-helix and ligand-binding sensor domain-containing protein n=1 Tax=Marinoscillum sp. TaxID=2024838 RepID=UPI003BAB9C39